ncbi:GtrA family protein [Neobacillus sp. FSL H8-0543]|uniref:GtrA family protein n=1 Tax=Neobacillus sp. FSL H8-0543 TaxID=2954672 RepID=UPI0031591EFE
MIRKHALANRMSIQKYEQFIKFCIIGIANTTISLAAYYLLLKLDTPYLIASTLAYFLGMANGYIFSTSFVFNQRHNALQAVKFISVSLFSLVINLLILYLLVDFFAIDAFTSQVIATIFNVIYTFSLNKFWTFGGTKSQ